jgi:hypothetical protein
MVSNFTSNNNLIPTPVQPAINTSAIISNLQQPPPVNTFDPMASVQQAIQNSSNIMTSLAETPIPPPAPSMNFVPPVPVVIPQTPSLMGVLNNFSMSPSSSLIPTPVISSSSGSTTQLMSLLQRLQNSGGTTGTIPVNPVFSLPNSGTQGAGTGITDLSKFELQLPVGSDGNPETIDGRDLQNHNNPYFQQDADKITFFAPVNGVHTTHSDFPRSELAQKESWNIATAPHSLSANLSIDQTPSNKTIVVGQLHEKSTDGSRPRPPIELVWQNGSLIASVRDSDNSTQKSHIVIADNIPPGQKFSYGMQVLPDGSVQITGNGQTKTIQLDSSFNNRYLYFKAGAYVQDNTGGENEGGKVSFYGLNMT